MTKRAITFVVVAHPDDESLWCGGTLARLTDGGGEVVIVCLTNGGNAARAAEFNAACRQLRARGVILDFPDGGHASLPRLDAALDRAAVDHCSGGILCVLTHSPHGEERGHFQHRQSHRLVQSWARGRGLPFGVFSDRAPSPGFRNPVLQGARLQLLRLTPPHFRHARRWLKGLGLMLRAKDNIRPVLRGDLGRDFLEARAALAISVDVPRKRALCALYASQLEGLQGYRSYDAALEFLYLDDMVAAVTLGKILEKD